MSRDLDAPPDVAGEIQTGVWRKREGVVLLIYVAVVGLVVAGMLRLVALDHKERPVTVGRLIGIGAHPEGPGSCTRCIGGTGTALPILEHLARALEDSGGERVELAASIGSSGGLAALRDGRLDCAVVSRELSQEEVEGFRFLPFARAPVVLVGSESLPVRSLSVDEVQDLYSGRVRTWSDGGPVMVLLREPGDSATRAFTAAVPSFAEVHERALADRIWPMELTDGAMQDALVKSHRSLGLFDLGILRLRELPLREVPVQGVTDLVRPLALVCRREISPATEAFVDFVCGEPGQMIMAGFGYQPARDRGAK
jgi:phosphate transport system substrate-binding protein